MDIDGNLITTANCTKDSFRTLQARAGLLSGATTHIYRVLPRRTRTRALFLRGRDYCRQGVGLDCNTWRYPVPTQVETRLPLSLVYRRHDRPSYRARNANALETHAVIESMKLDSRSEFANLKVDWGMTNRHSAIEVLVDMGVFEVVRPEMRESTALGSALLAATAVSLF